MYNGGLEAIITATYAQTSEVLQCKGSMSQNCYHIPYSTMRSRCILHMSSYTRSYYFPQCLRKVSLFPFGNIRARRTYFCFHGASFYWRLKCHARQTYWDPLSLWRMLAAISSQPWCSLFTLGLVYFHMLEMYEPLSCVLFFESSPETHASMNQKGCSLSVHSTPHLIQVLSAQWYVTWTQTLTVWFLSRVTSLPSAKVFPGVDILGIDPESHFQICDLLCQGHRIWLASLGNKLVQVYSSGPMDSGRLWLPWLGDL